MGLHSCNCFLLLALLANYLLTLQPSYSYSCHDHEKSALLQFKHSFIINCSASISSSAYPRAKSWADERDHHGDCCSWDGVRCDNETGHVIGLDLSSSCMYGTFPSNSTLFDLTHLRHLSLSDNHCNGSQIPSELGQLSKLVSLNLSDSSFSGQIPLAISSLAMLTLLDLSTEHGPKAYSQLRLEDPSLEMLVQNLTRLSQLYLDSVDISSPVPIVLANLTYLKDVMLQSCNLNGQFPTSIFHLPHLERLCLTANEDLVGILPEFQQNSPFIELALSHTSFHGRLPSSIGQLGNLQVLVLYDCRFFGPIPSSLGNLTKLRSLNLGGHNAFIGDLPSSLTNLTQLHKLGLSHLKSKPERLISWLFNLNKLTFLSLNYINLGSENEITSVIANLTSVTYLELEYTQLTGRLPHWLMNRTQLYYLSLLGNQLEGPISPEISQLANLHILSLSGNRNLSGNFDIFLKLKYLRILRLSGVKLTFLGKHSNNESVPTLNSLKLNSCHLTEFPQFLRSQNELQLLDLSNNDIQGCIPQWFVDATKESLHSLDLSNNYLRGFQQQVMVLPWTRLEMLYLQGNLLSGSLPIPPSSMAVYQVSGNQLVGGIPHWICQASSMKYLDISNNNLGGHIPNCLSKASRSLFVLNLEGNNFHGTIPSAYPKSCKLKMIDLSGNQLEGNLPRSLANCIDLEVLDVGRNQVNDTFPSWLGGLPKLHILVLGHNSFHGKIGRPKAGLDFHSLRIIDLSNNFHTGDVPLACLQNWDAMKLADESHSFIYGTTVPFSVSTPIDWELKTAEYNYSIIITNKGNDMQYTQVLTVFRVIDFSSNKFTGRIPNFIGELKGLQVLNLSNNNLLGKIPSSFANMTELESLDLSNNMLSGEIPRGLTQLTSLEVFNVSYNLLKGSIPEGSQFGTFDNSSFVGNSGLCGTPLSKKCENELESPPARIAIESKNDNEEESMLIDWIIRCLGCVGRFAFGCAFGKYLTDRNHEWFVETFGRRRRRPRTRGRRAARPRS